MNDTVLSTAYPLRINVTCQFTRSRLTRSAPRSTRNSSATARCSSSFDTVIRWGYAVSIASLIVSPALRCGVAQVELVGQGKDAGPRRERGPIPEGNAGPVPQSATVPLPVAILVADRTFVRRCVYNFSLIASMDCINS